MATTGVFNIRYNDYTPERSTVSGEMDTLTSVNFDAEYTDFQSFMTALEGITEGLRIGFDFMNREETIGPKTPASSETAQRERKWLVYYTTNISGDTYRMEIPCALLTGNLDPNNREKAHIGDSGDVDAFVSAFEAFVKKDGEGVSVTEIIHVGRNI